MLSFSLGEEEMKKIVYYVSEYGFGHAARSIALIRGILEQRAQTQIEVVNQYASVFLKESLPYSNVSHYHFSSDIGYVLKAGSVLPDKDKQIEGIERYLTTYPSLIDSEVERLRNKKVDLILSDISPLAFEVANQLEVPSIGISNFTWFTAFLDLVPLEVLGPLKSSYEKMDYFFALAGSNEQSIKPTHQFRFYSRRVDNTEVDKIRSKIGRNKKLVFLGLGMKMDLSDLQNLPIWNSPNFHFVVSSNLSIDHPNVSIIEKNYIETQNYIAACDLVITKAGWGTIAESVVAGVPLLIIEREGMKEDQYTINYLLENNLGRTIRIEEFEELILNDENFVKYTDYYSSLYSNSVDEIAKEVLKLIP